MGPNDAELIRVFTTGVGGGVGDVTFPVGSDFEIRADVEAGSAVFTSGPQFRTGVVLLDITGGASIFAAGVSGSVNSADWPTAAYTFVYAVPAANLAGRDLHQCEVRAFLLVGVTEFDASFAVSPTLLLTP